MQKGEKNEEVKKVADNRLLYTYMLLKLAVKDDGMYQWIY
jgi:hypothetical protein